MKYNKEMLLQMKADWKPSDFVFFPAEQPRYTCLVSQKAVPGGNFGRPGGGYMAGPVVRRLAESIIDK